MPNSPDFPFYSLDVGPVHLVSISTELYYYGSHEAFGLQHRWLCDDLSSVDRRLRPWIVVFGHRPMYCSTTDGMPCSSRDASLRIGRDGRYGLEDTLRAFGVDLYACGHIHAYERLWPVYNYTLVGKKRSYVDPGAVVQVSTGAAGNREMQDRFREEPSDWSAFRSTEYGYVCCCMCFLC